MIEQLKSMLAFAGPEAIREIFELYLADVPPRLAALETALAARDGEALRRAAHGLRGSSVSIGAEALAELCRELEDGSADPVSIVDAIRNETEWVVKLVNREIEGLGVSDIASTG